MPLSSHNLAFFDQPYQPGSYWYKTNTKNQIPAGAYLYYSGYSTAIINSGNIVG